MKESSFVADRLNELASVPEIVKVNSSSSTSEIDIVVIKRESVFSAIDIVDAILISGSSWTGSIVKDTSAEEILSPWNIV